jgi:hypothetical protein
MTGLTPLNICVVKSGNAAATPERIMVFAANAEAAYIKYASTTYPFIVNQNISTARLHNNCNVRACESTRLTRKEMKIRIMLIPTRIEPIAGTYHGIDA